MATITPRLAPDQRGRELMAAERAGTLPTVMGFYGHRRPESAPQDAAGPWFLSQWWHAPFTVDGTTYPTAEHWMMAGKAQLFDDLDAADAVLASPQPAGAKAVGRRVRGFDQAVWDEHAFALVITGTWHKFRSHPALSEYLLGTGDVVLAEASPSDRVWGIGMRANDFRLSSPCRWNGWNLLGFALMEVRELLSA